MIASVDHYNSTNTIYTFNETFSTAGESWIIKLPENFSDDNEIKAEQHHKMLIAKERKSWKEKRKWDKKQKYPKWGPNKPKVKR